MTPPPEGFKDMNADRPWPEGKRLTHGETMTPDRVHGGTVPRGLDHHSPTDVEGFQRVAKGKIAASAEVYPPKRDGIE